MALDTLGKRLKYAREKIGMKQNFAAKKLKISAPTLSNYESDFRRPDPVMLEKMVELYNVDGHWLLGSKEISGDYHEKASVEKNAENDVYADPEGWVDRLAAEYERKHNRKLENWKRTAIMELLEANKPKPPEEE